MNLILLNDNDFIGADVVDIYDRRSKHILKFYKSQVGDYLTVGLLNGKIGQGKVLSIENKHIKLKIILEISPPAPLPITLILALPRPHTLKKAIHVATSLGIKDIYLINSQKVEKSYWQSSLLKDNKLDNEIILALEQAKDSIPPKIKLRPRFKPFIEDEIPNIIKGSLPIIAHPYTNKNERAKRDQHISLAIGPEGGFTEYEVDKFIQLGFNTFNCGARILRVEFAIPTIVGNLLP